MKTRAIRWLIVIFVLLPFGALVLPTGPGGPSYRQKERIETIEAYKLNPSVSTKAAMNDEFYRLHHHYAMSGLVLLLSFLLVDVVVIYLFWNYGARKMERAR
jgi:hypothetical protein